MKITIDALTEQELDKIKAYLSKPENKDYCRVQAEVAGRALLQGGELVIELKYRNAVIEYWPDECLSERQHLENDACILGLHQILTEITENRIQLRKKA